MMSFVPALIYNVLYPLKIGSAERCDVAAEIDDLGEARQLRQLLTREELEIKIVKQPFSRQTPARACCDKNCPCQH